MTYNEALKVLAILKAAYPKYYPYTMSVDDAKVTAITWAEQFIDIPGEIVEIAVKKIISKNEDGCTPARVKKQIGSLYWEAKQLLEDDDRAKRMGCGGLSDKQRMLYKAIQRASKEYKCSKAIDLPLNQIVGESKMLLIGGDTE